MDWTLTPCGLPEKATTGPNTFGQVQIIVTR